ncbi:nuclear receptor corepressor 2 isoform X1 [Manduca sexta]|uniref:nuclear receptor corepressor 2 isoform X1 n=1 Tax=Manduca sexta TaxID=7130 RepID=UPI001183F295|nr:nuclear receptor corepressor 2 isoform X1 [Manduca sexta]
MSNRSWVTLATNDSYGLGALVLAHSLRRAGSVYPAVVLITPSVTEAMRERLRAVFAEVVTVDVLDSRDAAHLALLQRPELGITFTKIHCWNLTQYEKCVFLDADILVVQNCDELFEREELSAAPDVGWPDCFNSGVFVFKPSAETFENLIKFAQERGSFDGGDQGLLNSFFSDWAHGDINKHLPFLYNVTSAAFYSYLPALKHYGQNLKIIHFIGAAKPWLQQFNWESRHVDAPEHLREFLQLWWDLFVSQVHSHLDVSMVEVEVQQHEIVDTTPVLPSQDVNQYIHYQPVLDPESEFPWHRPEAQTQDELNISQLEMSEFHDPWGIYRGHIPPISDDTTTQRADGRVENQEEVRKYAWEYQAQEYRRDSTSQHHQDVWNFSHQAQHDSQQHHSEFYTETVYNQDINHSVTEHWHTYQHAEKQSEEQNTYSHYEPAHWRKEHSYPEYPQHDFVHNSTDNRDNSNEQNSQEFTYSNQESHSQNTQDRDNHEQFHYSQLNQNSSFEHHTFSEQTTQLKEHSHKTIDVTNYYAQEIAQQDIEVHHVHVEQEKELNHLCQKDGITNGDISDSESEIDDIKPRHPYDGYYLRHRVTIDSRGRKICTHEIPPAPSPSSSESPTPQDYYSAEETQSDDEDQSGVAGNLARVALGGGHEAIDDLTRRQGWEAGNIDYMGVDAFENIWAKISQTLSQPRSSPPKQSPPREPAPAASQPSVVSEKPMSEEIEVAKEALPVEAPVVPAEVPAPVEAPVVVPTEIEAPVVPAEVAAPVEEVVTSKTTAPSEVVAPVEAPAAVSTQVVSDVSSPVAVPDVVPVVVKAAEPAPVAAEAPVAPEPAADSKPAAQEVPAPVEAAAPIEIPESEVPVPVEAIDQISVPKEAEPEVKKTEAPEIKSSPAEAAVEAPKCVKPVEATPASPAPAEAAGSPAVPEATPEKVQAADVSTDSPPLANTPSKEEAPAVPAAKSAERRKPAGKLQLGPPAAPDPLPTPDSELEDAAALAQSIIASEMRTPTVTAPSPAAASPSVAPEQTRLAVDDPEVPTPPVGAVSLSQIGVKPAKGKSSTAAQIESSVTEKAEPPTPTSPAAEVAPATPKAPAAPTASAAPAAPAQAAPAPAADAPKKKVVKKVVKKEGAGGADAPVPPPRKKEKKPKEK